jgi:hypothetical protein
MPPPFAKDPRINVHAQQEGFAASGHDIGGKAFAGRRIIGDQDGTASDPIHDLLRATAFTSQ